MFRFYHTNVGSLSEKDSSESEPEQVLKYYRKTMKTDSKFGKNIGNPSKNGEIRRSFRKNYEKT
jgi:hypothetical protein